MVTKIKNRKLNNKGLSLMEVLVAVAISAIVATLLMTFMTSGSSFFKKQTNSINLQNDLQEASNKVTDALMEATSISIKEDSDALWIYTGNFAEPNPKVKPKLILWFKKAHTLYVMDYNLTDADKADEGYCMSKHVTDFKIELDSLKEVAGAATHEWVTVASADSGTGDAVAKLVDRKLAQPLMFRVSITLENNGEVRSDSKSTTLRNKIDVLKIENTEYSLD